MQQEKTCELKLKELVRDHHCEHGDLIQDVLIVRYLIQCTNKSHIELHQSESNVSLQHSHTKKLRVFPEIEAAGIPWEELFKVENGFIGKDKSLTFVVQVSFMCRAYDPCSTPSSVYPRLLYDTDADLMFKCGDIEIPMHKKALEIHAKNLLSIATDILEKGGEIIGIDGAHADVLAKFLEFCYSPTEFKKHKENYSVELFDIAEKLKSLTLLNSCYRMMNCLLTTENVFQTMDIAHRLSYFILFRNCMGFIKM